MASTRPVKTRGLIFTSSEDGVTRIGFTLLPEHPVPEKTQNNGHQVKDSDPEKQETNEGSLTMASARGFEGISRRRCGWGQDRPSLADSRRVSGNGGSYNAQYPDCRGRSWPGANSHTSAAFLQYSRSCDQHMGLKKLSKAGKRSVPENSREYSSALDTTRKSICSR